MKSFRRKIAVVVFYEDKLSTIEYFDENELDKAFDAKKVYEEDGREVLIVPAFLPSG